MLKDSASDLMLYQKLFGLYVSQAIKKNSNGWMKLLESKKLIPPSIRNLDTKELLLLEDLLE